MREASLPPSHGIEAEGWQHALAGGIDKLPDLPLKITGGTFAELSRVTGNIERFVIQSEPLFNYMQRIAPQPYPLSRPGATTIKTPTMIAIRMVLERVPDLSDLFAITFVSTSKCYPAAVSLHPEVESLDIRIFETELGLPDGNDIRAAINLPADAQRMKSQPVAQLGESLLFRLRISSKDELPGKLPTIKSNGEGNTYAVELLPDGLDLSSLSLLYLVSYAMGMLARYYPSKWLSLLNSGKGDFVYPLMKAAIKVVEERFPQLVLYELGAM